MNEGLSEIYNRDKNKKLLFVYAMAKRDINISKVYLDKIQNTTSDIYERDSNIIALYIIYGRIFGKNFDLPKLEIKKLKCTLTEDEKNLHESMIHSRNKIFAHSDASMSNIEVLLGSNDKLITIPKYNTTFIENYYAIAKSLFEKILNKVDEKINELLQYLYAQDNGYKITKQDYVLLGYSNNFFENRMEKK